MAMAGGAPALQAGSREFESHPVQNSISQLFFYFIDPPSMILFFKKYFLKFSSHQIYFYFLLSRFLDFALATSADHTFDETLIC